MAYPADLLVAMLLAPIMSCCWFFCSMGCWLMHAHNMCFGIQDSRQMQSWEGHCVCMCAQKRKVGLCLFWQSSTSCVFVNWVLAMACMFFPMSYFVHTFISLYPKTECNQWWLRCMLLKKQNRYAIGWLLCHHHVERLLWVSLLVGQSC